MKTNLLIKPSHSNKLQPSTPTWCKYMHVHFHLTYKNPPCTENLPTPTPQLKLPITIHETLSIKT